MAGVDDADVVGEVSGDIRRVDEAVFEPVQMVGGVRQQATSHPHRVADMHGRVVWTVVDEWRVSQPHCSSEHTPSSELIERRYTSLYSTASQFTVRIDSKKIREGIQKT